MARTRHGRPFEDKRTRLAALPEVRPANEIDDANGGNKDNADVEEEPGGRVAVLVGSLTGHSQEEENQAGDAEENGPERNAGDVGGQGRHAVMLANTWDHRDICSRLLSPLLNLWTQARAPGTCCR